MTLANNAAPTGMDRFDQAEDLLSRYPAVTTDEVKDLKRWFSKEASAFDVASLASKEEIHASYRAFRRDHIDGFRIHEILAAGGVVMLIAAGILVLAV